MTFALASYSNAKAAQQIIIDEVAVLSAALRNFPTDALGLTPDGLKFSHDHRRAKRAFRLAFERLKNFNFQFNRRFRDDIRADRKRAWEA